MPSTINPSLIIPGPGKLASNEADANALSFPIPSGAPGSATAGNTYSETTVSSDLAIPSNATYVWLRVDTSASRNITLPAAASVLTGRFFFLKDITGSSEANAITVTLSGSDTLDGTSTSKTLRGNYGTWTVVSDGVSRWDVFYGVPKTWVDGTIGSASFATTLTGAPTIVTSASGNTSVTSAAGNTSVNASGTTQVTSGTGTTVTAASGNTSVTSAAGNTSINANGTTQVTSGTGTTVTATTGGTTITCAAGNTSVTCAAGNTSINASGATQVTSGTGTTITATTGGTTVTCAAGNTSLTSAAGTTQVSSQTGTTVTCVSGGTTITATAGGTTITCTAGNTSINSAAGTTTIDSANGTTINGQGTVVRSHAGAAVSLGSTNNDNDLNIWGTLSFKSGLFSFTNTIPPTSGTHTIDGGSNRQIVIFVDTSSVACNLTLPATLAGRTLFIKDISGNASTNNITLIPNSVEKIEGRAAHKVLSANWGSWIVITDGTDWYLWR